MYCELIQYMLQVDFMSFNHKAVTMIFLDNAIRFSAFLSKTPSFHVNITRIFFSQKAILSNDKELASKSVSLFLRMVERFN